MSVKYRQRYIALSVRPGDLGLMRSILSSVSSALDPSYPRPRLILHDEENEEFLIKCGHLQVDELIDRIVNFEGDKPAMEVEILGVSGTIKAANKKFLSS